MDHQALTDVLTRIIFDGTFVSSMDHIVTTRYLGFFRSLCRIRRPWADVTPATTQADVFARSDVINVLCFEKFLLGILTLRH